MKSSTTSQRLNHIMNIRNLRQADILNLIKPYCIRYNVKLGKSALSQYISGKVTPKQDKIFILGIALDVSEAWLMGYDVPMERTPTPKNPEELRKLPISELRQELINAALDAPEEDLKEACDIFDYLSHKRNKQPKQRS